MMSCRKDAKAQSETPEIDKKSLRLCAFVAKTSYSRLPGLTPTIPTIDASERLPCHVD
jgi:hypothetical protein